jgi:hypothetical protein
MAGTRERKEHRLKLFVGRYLANGGDGIDAAKFAGHGGTPASLSVTGSRLLRLAKQRGLLEKGKERVRVSLERDATAWAKKLWEQAEQGNGSAESQESWKDDNGRFQVRKYKPQAALIALSALYAPKDGNGQAPVQVNVLNVLPPQLAAQVYKALLGPTNGNGAGA